MSKNSIRKAGLEIFIRDCPSYNAAVFSPEIVFIAFSTTGKVVDMLASWRNPSWRALISMVTRVWLRLALNKPTWSAESILLADAPSLRPTWSAESILLADAPSHPSQPYYWTYFKSTRSRVYVPQNTSRDASRDASRDVVQTLLQPPCIASSD